MKITRARLVAAERIALEEVALEPRPDRLLVRNLASGICHSEKFNWVQDPGDRNIGLGHEPVGEIVEVGREVTGDWQVGQRISGYWGPGCATYALADPAQVVLVPPDLPTEHALGEVLACLVTCARGWQHEVGDHLALVGCGFMGVLSAQLVRATARCLIAIDLRPERLAFAQRHGATHTVDARGDVVAAVREITAGALCQVVGEATGVGAGLDLALQLTGGFRPVVNVISWLNQPLTLQNLGLLANGVVLRNPHPKYAPDSRRELQLGLEFAARGVWGLDDAITHRWPLEQVDSAYRVAMRAEDGYLKGVITLS
ncbi:MAG: zinc-binding dehydrogenase [Fimbriimonadaceae bacterium]|nr:zinc-binding dehydrogenase [Fimbriimonadaceae bacterium]